MMYYVNWVLTTAQMELIAADVSVVDYDMNDDKKKRRKGEFDDSSADAKSVRKAGEEWIAKYGDSENAGKGLAIGDIFGASMSADVGVKIKQ